MFEKIMEILTFIAKTLYNILMFIGICSIMALLVYRLIF